MSEMAPVARQERIAAMDVLRGMAVFGIFLINMPLYLGPSSAFFDWEKNVLWTREADRLALLFVHVFAQGKFYTLFSFLFGLGFGVQLMRAAERGVEGFDAIYKRRLQVLLVIGLLHFLFVWWGDVLHVYALLGFLLLVFRSFENKSLLIWALCLASVPMAGKLGVDTIQHFRAATKNEEQVKREQTANDARIRRMMDEMRTMSRGTGRQILELRLMTDVRQATFEIGWATELFGSFLLGLWAARRRVVEAPREHLQLLRWLAFAGLPAGLAVTAAYLVWGYLHPLEEAPLWRVQLGALREFVARPAMAYGYAAVVLLIGVRGWMAPLAAVGRTALSNYLLQSLVFTTVANSYGGGLYGRVHPLQGLIWCAGFFALQMAGSWLWMRWFAYGPAEWVWRSLTYGKRQRWVAASR